MYQPSLSAHSELDEPNGIPAPVSCEASCLMNLDKSPRTFEENDDMFVMGDEFTKLVKVLFLKDQETLEERGKDIKISYK